MFALVRALISSPMRWACVFRPSGIWRATVLAPLDKMKAQTWSNLKSYIGSPSHKERGRMIKGLVYQLSAGLELGEARAGQLQGRAP